MNQWLTSEFTLNIPEMFKNDFSPHASWVETFGRNDENLLKSEINFFVSIQPIFDSHAISLRDTFREFKDFVLYEPLFLMDIIRDTTTLGMPFEAPVFVSWLGMIYKNRGFSDLLKPTYIQDMLEETESVYLRNIQRAALRNNGNPLIRTTTGILPYPKMIGNKVE